MSRLLCSKTTTLRNFDVSMILLSFFQFVLCNAASDLGNSVFESALSIPVELDPMLKIQCISQGSVEGCDEFIKLAKQMDLNSSDVNTELARDNIREALPVLESWWIKYSTQSSETESDWQFLAVDDSPEIEPPLQDFLNSPSSGRNHIPLASSMFFAVDELHSLLDDDMPLYLVEEIKLGFSYAKYFAYARKNPIVARKWFFWRQVFSSKSSQNVVTAFKELFEGVAVVDGLHSLCREPEISSRINKGHHESIKLACESDSPRDFLPNSFLFGDGSAIDRLRERIWDIVSEISPVYSTLQLALWAVPYEFSPFLKERCLNGQVPVSECLGLIKDFVFTDKPGNCSSLDSRDWLVESAVLDFFSKRMQNFVIVRLEGYLPLSEEGLEKFLVHPVTSKLSVTLSANHLPGGIGDRLIDEAKRVGRFGKVFSLARDFPIIGDAFWRQYFGGFDADKVISEFLANLTKHETLREAVNCFCDDPVVWRSLARFRSLSRGRSISSAESSSSNLGYWMRAVCESREARVEDYQDFIDQSMIEEVVFWLSSGDVEKVTDLLNEMAIRLSLTGIESKSVDRQTFKNLRVEKFRGDPYNFGNMYLVTPTSP